MTYFVIFQTFLYLKAKDMAGETDLTVLLRAMQPVLFKGEYVFCSIDYQRTNWLELNPVSFFREEKGLTLILLRERADNAALPYTSVFRMITLERAFQFVSCRFSRCHHW